MGWILSAFADEAGEAIDEQIGALTEAQVQHVDLRNVDGFNITELPVEHARRIQKKLDSAGISVGMFGSPIGKIDIFDDFEIDVQRMAHLRQMKEIFGASNVRIFSYFNRKEASYTKWQLAALERLQGLVELAEKYDLVLYHEHEPGVYGGDLATVCVLRDELHKKNPERFRLIFDFDNFNQAGEDVWQNYLELRMWVHAVHLKESQKQPDGSFMHVPVGQGDGQIRRILEDLAGLNWQGPLTLEPHLARSSAVLKTGPHGLANNALSNLTPHQCFVVAAEAARGMLQEVGRLEA